MSVSRAEIPKQIERQCPVAAKLEQYGKTFGLAASDATTLAEDLDDALYGLAQDITPADLRAANVKSLEVTADNLNDLLDQVQEALAVIERIQELRSNPDAAWPV